MAIQTHLYSENLGYPIDSMENFDNACGFNQFFSNPQQQQQNFLQIQQQQQQQFHIVNPKNNQILIGTSGYNTNSTQSMVFSQTLACQFEKQRLEIDQFISLQNERLRLALQEQRKQQVALILRNYQSKTQFLLKQKDEEIAKAMNKSRELQEFLKKMEMENQTWQMIAKEKEAIVMSLNNTIEQLAQSGAAGDAESCCEVQPAEHDVQASQQQQENVEQEKMMCKSCCCRKLCVVFLPCRHLSSCKDCDPLLVSCPVCNVAKKASIEALI